MILIHVNIYSIHIYYVYSTVLDTGNAMTDKTEVMPFLFLSHMQETPLVNITFSPEGGKKKKGSKSISPGKTIEKLFLYFKIIHILEGSVIN